MTNLSIETAAQRIIDAAIAEAAGRYERLVYWQGVAERALVRSLFSPDAVRWQVCRMVADELDQALFAHPDSPFRLNADTAENDFEEWRGL